MMTTCDACGYKLENMEMLPEHISNAHPEIAEVMNRPRPPFVEEPPPGPSSVLNALTPRIDPLTGEASCDYCQRVFDSSTMLLYTSHVSFCGVCLLLKTC